VKDWVEGQQILRFHLLFVLFYGCLKIPERILNLLLPSGNQSLEGKSALESDFTVTVVCPIGFSATTWRGTGHFNHSLWSVVLFLSFIYHWS